MRSHMMVNLLSLVKRKKIAYHLQLNQLAFKNSHQEILLSHFSHMVESNAISRKPYTQLNHGQEVAKCIKPIEFATHTSLPTMAAISNLVTFQCGGINA